MIRQWSKQARGGPTYTWASGSEGEMMQLCMGVNGRRMTSAAAFFIFSLPYVLKQKQKQSEWQGAVLIAHIFREGLFGKYH